MNYPFFILFFLRNINTSLIFFIFFLSLSLIIFSFLYNLLSYNLLSISLSLYLPLSNMIHFLKKNY